jgi:hypothetical protein
MAVTIADKIRVFKQTLIQVGCCIFGLNLVTFVALWHGLSYKPGEPIPSFDGCHMFARIALWATGAALFSGVCCFIMLLALKKYSKSEESVAVADH